MKNHFRLFDYILDIIADDITKENIIEMNKILKGNSSYENNPRYNIEGFRIVPNEIGLITI